MASAATFASAMPFRIATGTNTARKTSLYQAQEPHLLDAFGTYIDNYTTLPGCQLCQVAKATDKHQIFYFPSSKAC